MSLSVFSPDILPSPFVATDQLITSLAYSADSELWGSHFSIFLVPQDSILYPTSMLWILYAYILQNPHINRIVYLREGEQQESIRPIDTGIDFVLWSQINYDMSYYNMLDFETKSVDDFPINQQFFASHMMYARLLDSIKVVPIVLWKWFKKKNNNWLQSLFGRVMNDSQTLCVLCQNSLFTFDEKDQVVLSDVIDNSYILQSFYNYSAHIKTSVTLLQSEVYDTKSLWNEIEQTFQWIFAL